MWPSTFVSNQYLSFHSFSRTFSRVLCLLRMACYGWLTSFQSTYAGFVFPGIRVVSSYQTHYQNCHHFFIGLKETNVMTQLRGALQMKLAELNKITLSYVRVLRHCSLTFLYFISLKISSSKITHLVAHTQNNNVNRSFPSYGTNFIAKYQ